MKKILGLVIFLLIFTWASVVQAQQQQVFARIRDNNNKNVMADVLQTAATFAVDLFGLLTTSVTYFFDGNNWRRWLGSQSAVDNVSSLTWRPWVGNLNYIWDTVDDNWDRMSAIEVTLSAKDMMALLVYSANMYWDLDYGWFNDWQGAALGSDTIPVTQHAPYVGSFGHTYNTVGNVWSRISSYATTDNLALPTAPFCISVTTLYDGATLDMARATATGGLLAGIETWHCAFDAGNCRANTFKDDTNVYNPGVTAGTAVSNNVPEIVCASAYLLNTPNWSVWVKNVGGGSGDTLTDVDVQASYNNADFSSLTSTACDGLVSGASARCYVASNESVAWVVVYANVDVGDDTTIDCGIQGNKN